MAAPSPRSAVLAALLLLGCVLGVAVYGACAVLVGTAEGIGAGAGLALQALWQAGVVRGLYGPSRRTPVVLAGAALLAFAVGGAIAYAGGSAFYGVSLVVLVPMPAAALLCARWARRRRVTAPARR